MIFPLRPRGWSCLHAIEVSIIFCIPCRPFNRLTVFIQGTNTDCSAMVITNNDIGPSGHAPSGVNQFRRRDNTGNYGPGECEPAFLTLPSLNLAG